MNIPENAKYADVVRIAMKTTENATGEQLTLRDLSRRLNYSYEHLRKILKGEPVVSQEFNQQLCDLLGLDAPKMWSLMTREKVAKRFKGVPMPLRPPSDEFFAENWSRLTPENVETLRQMMEAMLVMNERRRKAVREVETASVR